MERAAINWFEDEEFWEASYPFMFPEASFASAVEDVSKILNFSGCAGKSVLDLCCGPGRHSIPLARQGYSVTGVDRTECLLDRARAFAADEDVEVEWVLEDMRRFVRPDHFDLALSLFTSFGYFDEASDNFEVLKNVLASLKPGGVFVVDVAGKEHLARIYQATGSQELASGGVLVQRRTIHDDWSKMLNEWFLVQDGDARRFKIGHWLYSGFELKQLLASAGFAEVTLYGDFDGGEYGPEAKRLIAVARKG